MSETAHTQVKEAARHKRCCDHVQAKSGMKIAKSKHKRQLRRRVRIQICSTDTTVFLRSPGLHGPHRTAAQLVHSKTALLADVPHSYSAVRRAGHLTVQGPDTLRVGQQKKKAGQEHQRRARVKLLPPRVTHPLESASTLITT